MGKEFKNLPAKFCSEISIVHGIDSYLSMVHRSRKHTKQCMYVCMYMHLLLFSRVLLDKKFCTGKSS